MANAVAEGLNSKIQTIKKRAYGFRNDRRMLSWARAMQTLRDAFVFAELERPLATLSLRYIACRLASSADVCSNTRPPPAPPIIRARRTHQRSSREVCPRPHRAEPPSALLVVVRRTEEPGNLVPCP